MARSTVGTLTLAILFVAALAALAGCTGASATGVPNLSPGSSPSTRSSPSASQGLPDRPSFPGVSLPTQSGTPVKLPASILDPILADAAGRAEVAVSQLIVTDQWAVTWPDGSLGCAQPGQAYIQVVLEGYRVIVQAGPTVYDYRGAGTTGFKLCQALRT